MEPTPLWPEAGGGGVLLVICGILQILYIQARILETSLLDLDKEPTTNSLVQTKICKSQEIVPREAHNARYLTWIPSWRQPNNGDWKNSLQTHKPLKCHEQQHSRQSEDWEKCVEAAARPGQVWKETWQNR